jgi:hypothetical protein
MTDGPLCVACGETHFLTEREVNAALRVGISHVHPDCAWTLRYPGKSANEVIVELERKLSKRAHVGAAAGTSTDRTDEPSPPEAISVADDPQERGGGEYVEEKLCPICEGDGELVDPEDPNAVSLCGRCNGNGRVQVTG